MNDLLSGLAEAPYELDRALVLSDWLEDQGDPQNIARAELLRLTAWLEANALNPFVLEGQPCQAEYAAIRQRAYELILGGMEPIRPMKSVLGMDFMWISPGLFERGEGESRHIVLISKGFWMARTQVTQSQWQAVMGSNPSHFKGDDNRPVEMVSWHDCQEFCQRVSQATGLAVQLPTEAQWEWACRGTTTTLFYSGDTEEDLRKVGWYWGNSDGKTHPVAQLRPNLWGLYDMHGNVWEWCQDWYGPYSLEGAVPLQEALGRLCVRDPVGVSGGTNYVIHSGCWGSGASACQSSARSNDSPSNSYCGFRMCVCVTQRGQYRGLRVQSGAAIGEIHQLTARHEFATVSRRITRHPETAAARACVTRLVQRMESVANSLGVAQRLLQETAPEGFRLAMAHTFATTTLAAARV